MANCIMHLHYYQMYDIYVEFICLTNSTMSIIICYVYKRSAIILAQFDDSSVSPASPTN